MGGLTRQTTAAPPPPFSGGRTALMLLARPAPQSKKNRPARLLPCIESYCTTKRHARTAAFFLFPFSFPLSLSFFFFFFFFFLVGWPFRRLNLRGIDGAWGGGTGFVRPGTPAAALAWCPFFFSHGTSAACICVDTVNMSSRVGAPGLVSPGSNGSGSLDCRVGGGGSLSLSLSLSPSSCPSIIGFFLSVLLVEFLARVTCLFRNSSRLGQGSRECKMKWKYKYILKCPFSFWT